MFVDSKKEKKESVGVYNKQKVNIQKIFAVALHSCWGHDASI